MPVNLNTGIDRKKQTRLINSQQHGHGDRDRQRTPRFPFVAKAQVCEVGSNEWLEPQVSEISLNGCYLDMMNPLPIGSEVHVKIFGAEEFFEAAAKVVYSNPNLGMGLSYHDINSSFVPTTQKWLLAAMRKANRTN